VKYFGEIRLDPELVEPAFFSGDTVISPLAIDLGSIYV